MPLPDAILVGSQLSRSFGQGPLRVEALRAVCLAVCRGELLLLMGPSGSGKSTLLAVLSGLLRPDSGQVLALGTDLWSLSDRDRERFRLHHFSFVFQGYNLFPSLGVGQQLEMVLHYGFGIPRRERRLRVADVLRQLGLAGRVGAYPEQLSGGEKQRVAVARALLKNPAVCFADEPTAALDWAHGQQVIELLSQKVRRQGGSVLLVAHDPRVLPFADRVLYLEDGCVRLAPPGTAPALSAGP